MIKTVEWTDDGVIMVDQRRLPTEELYPIFRTYQEIAVAIKEMVVRGAPAIGVTAAMGVARGLVDSKATTVTELEADLTEISRVIGATRPTAVNLFWAIERMRMVFNNQKTEGTTVDEIKRRLVDEAKAVYQEDLTSGEQLGLLGGELIPDHATVLTHCNAGALATAGGYGTALGVIRGAVALGKKIHVFADETRPFLQGARLTAWELMKDDIPVTLITDNMSGHFMKAGKIDCIVVGADRIAANGDTANKIGTYMVAVLAREHNIPFYVAAPISTLDLAIPSGEHIPIEDRTITEVTHIKGQQVAPTGVTVANPAFDVTPHRFIAAIITDRGVARPPYTETLQALMRS